MLLTKCVYTIHVTSKAVYYIKSIGLYLYYKANTHISIGMPDLCFCLNICFYYYYADNFTLVSISPYYIGTKSTITYGSTRVCRLAMIQLEFEPT